MQIVSAVQYCHQKRIVHRDLKVRHSTPTRACSACVCSVLLVVMTQMRHRLDVVVK